MDERTGRLTQVSGEAEARFLGLVPVRRALTAKEVTDMQIRLYSPCGCGSGKKFKFCCRAKNRPAPGAQDGGAEAVNAEAHASATKEPIA